jgi:uncharacterized tellurite resistance protein B-like protein
MSNPNLILTLGKVIIATAWVDEHVSKEEIDSLKDLTFRLPELTSSQWAELEMYIETPVGEPERFRLVTELQQLIKTDDDLNLATQALDDLINADGAVTPEEEAVVASVKSSLRKGGGNFFSGLSGFVTNLLQRRSGALVDAPNREDHFEDYMKNKVYYKVQQRLERDGASLEIADAELRKLCLAGGIMAQVARVNAQITDEEFDTIAGTLQTGWRLSRTEAVFITEVAISEAVTSFDKLRLAREFLKVTRPGEPKQFLEILFGIAAADGDISADEAEHIRSIARTLLLSNKEFTTARKQAMERLKS